MKLPEPIGVITGKLGDHCSFMSNVMRKGDAVYSESQIKELLVKRDTVLKMALDEMKRREHGIGVVNRLTIKAIQEILK